MSRIKQRPNKYGISQVETGPARRPPARSTRSSLPARAHLQTQAEQAEQAEQAQHPQSQPQPVNTRARRQANVAATDSFLTQDFEHIVQQRSTSSLFPALDVVTTDSMELTDGEGDAAQHSGIVEAAAQETQVEDIEDAGDESIEAADDIEDADDIDEAEVAEAAKTDEIEDVGAHVYEFDSGGVPPKRRRVAHSASPNATKQKSASTKGRRQTVANIVQKISDAMAMASPKPAMTAALLEAGETEDVAAPDADEEEANAEVDEEMEVKEQLVQTQEGDVIVVTGSDEEVDEDEDDADADEDDNEMLKEVEAQEQDEQQGQEEQLSQPQQQSEPTQTSQETRMTNGTGSAYAISDAGESQPVPPPSRHQPPRKMAANPKINVPPEARRAAEKPASEERAPQGVKRKRSRPKKIVEPITTEPESPQRPARASRAAAAKKTHPPPTRITESSLQSTSQHRKSPSADAAAAVSVSNFLAARNLPRSSPVRFSMESDFAPDSDCSSSSSASAETEVPLKFVQFNTEMVSSLVALMCRDGWTGQRMWKGTFRWYHQGQERIGVTYQAYRLMAELGKLEESYRDTPSLEDSDDIPRLADVLHSQENLLDRHPVQCQEEAESVEVITSNLLAICEMLFDSILPPTQATNSAAYRDADNARRFRAIVADDLVSYLIPMVVSVIETACCLGGRKPEGGPVEAGCFVPLKTVRMTLTVWNRVNQATRWLVRLESALAQELGYREQHDMSLAVADAKIPSSGPLAHNRSQSSDRAHLKRLLNRLQDDLCEARNCLEREPEYEPGQMPALIDLTDVGRDSDVQMIDGASEDKDEGEEEAEVYMDADGDNAKPKPKAKATAKAATKAKPKATKKAKAKGPATRQVAKPTYQVEEIDNPSAPSAQDETDGRAKSIEILIPTQVPQSTEVAEAAGDDEAQIIGETANDEAAGETANEEAVDAAVVDAIEVASGEEAAGDGDEQQQEEPSPARTAAAEKAKEKTPQPKKSFFSHDWNLEEDSVVIFPAPLETAAASANADSNEDSQGTSMFVRPHSEVPEQPVDVVATTEEDPAPAPAPEPAPASSPAPAAAPTSPSPTRPAPKTARKRAKLLAAQDSQDQPVSSDFTRDEKKMILALLRTKGASFDLVRLAAEMGRETLDVAIRVESIKTAFRERELRLGKTSPPAWMQAGYKLDNPTEPSGDA